MKADSLFRHIWVGILFCSMMTFAAVAFADEPANGGTKGKTDASAKEVLITPPQQEPASVKKKTDPSAITKDPVAPAKAEEKTEVKKDNTNNGHFSFSFLYYLFYKGNFAENTNKAILTSWNTLLYRLLN